jgi:hypothetical protein
MVNEDYQRVFEGGQGGSAALGDLGDVDLQLKNSRPMTVFLRTVSSTGGTLDALSINWAENW